MRVDVQTINGVEALTVDAKFLKQVMHWGPVDGPLSSVQVIGYVHNLDGCGDTQILFQIPSTQQFRRIYSEFQKRTTTSYVKYRQKRGQQDKVLVFENAAEGDLFWNNYAALLKHTFSLRYQIFL